MAELLITGTLEGGPLGQVQALIDAAVEPLQKKIIELEKEINNLKERK